MSTIVDSAERLLERAESRWPTSSGETRWWQSVLTVAVAIAIIGVWFLVICAVIGYFLLQTILFAAIVFTSRNRF